MATNSVDTQIAKALEDAFIKISFEEDSNMKEKTLYGDWADNASGKRSDPQVFGADMLRKLYPKHSLVMVADYSINILAYPGAFVVPLNPKELVTNLYFIPFARSLGGVPGVLVNRVRFGAFQVAWDKYDFILYQAEWEEGFQSFRQSFILYEGPGGEEPAKALIMACGAWYNELHEEIWVYNQSFWRKDHQLWLEIQKANWHDIILKEDFKNSFRKDIYSFFSSKDLYKKYSIPWKRGVIMYGPPGNGKTISIKALMKDLDAKGHVPLYVKTLRGYRGEEGSLTEVFSHARRNAPCVVIFEDLDTMINDNNRSFFLNELDGLEGNDGLLVIGTTNHLDKLDPGLSARPSRFDRKYNFDDPDEEERKLYIKYWQNKLLANENVDFPATLVGEIVDMTHGFSFAYLKEAFVSSLVLLLQNDKQSFRDIIKKQIQTLRKELNKAPRSFDKQPQVLYRNSSNLPSKPEQWEIATSMAIQAAVSAGREFV